MAETVEASPGLKVETLIGELSPSYVKETYLRGLDFVDAPAVSGDPNTPYPDAWYLRHINNAIVQFERETKICVLRRTITDEVHDYNVADYQAFNYVQLYNYPVVSVEAFNAIYPTGQTVFNFPVTWIRLNKEHGQVQLVPTQGSLSSVILGQGGTYLPLIYSGLGYLPGLFHVDYTAGFAPGKIPFDVLDAICKLACISMLGLVGLTIFPPGVTSMSAGIDGLSQSMGMTTPFSGLLEAYRAELYGDGRAMTGQLKLLREHYRGLTMRVV